MKYLVPILVALLCSPTLIAAPGGGHHKITEFDYVDYLNAGIESKTFLRHVQGIDYDLVWYFDRTNPNYTVRTEIATDAYDNIVYYAENVLARTPRTFEWLEQRNYDWNVTPPALTETIDYDPPVVVLHDAMVPGIAWGSAGAINSSSSGENFYTDKSEILAIEDVTVPAGTFNDCLKIHRLREFAVAITINRMEWYCPNVGLVKQIQGGRRMIEMTGFTLAE